MTFQSIAAEVRQRADDLQMYVESEGNPCRHTASFVGTAYSLRRLADRLDMEADAAFGDWRTVTTKPAVIRACHPDQIEVVSGLPTSGLLVLPTIEKPEDEPEDEDLGKWPSMTALVLRLKNRGGVVVKVEGEWWDVRVHLLQGSDAPVLALADIERLLRAEEVRGDVPSGETKDKPAAPDIGQIMRDASQAMNDALEALRKAWRS